MPSVTRCALDRFFSASNDERARGIYNVRYKVQTDGQLGPKTLIAGAQSASPHPLPSLWASYSAFGETDSFSFARDFNAQYVSDTLYSIDVTYRPLDPGESSGVSNPTPTARPAVYDWDSEVYTEYVDKDKDGDPIVNFCGRRYDDPVEVERTRGVLVVEWNVANLAAVIQHNRTFELATNTSSFTIGGVTIGEREAFCRSVQSQRQETEGGTVFYTEIYRIVFKPAGETWDVGIAEQGFTHWKWNIAAGSYWLATEVEALPQIEQQRMKYEGEDADGSGRAIFSSGDEPARLAEDGTPLSNDVHVEGIFRDWRVYRESDFNNLPFLI